MVKHRVWMAAVVAAVTLGFTVGAAWPAGAATAHSVFGPSVRLPGAPPALPSGAAVVGPSDPGSRITVDVSLSPRDLPALQRTAAAVSTPGSPQYHHFLGRGQFASLYGPTAATLSSVRDWLQSAGLHVGTTSSNGLLVPATGTVATVEQAFSVPLVRARLADGRVARAARATASVPSSFVSEVSGVVGLSTVAQLTPQLATDPSTAPGTGVPDATTSRATSTTSTTSTNSTITGSTAESSAVAHVGPSACSAAARLATGSPSHGWTATQLASTYGMSTLYGQGRAGAGIRVGIFELEPFTPSDISAYQACFGTSVPVSTVDVDGGAEGTQHGEAALDIEVVAGLAPSSAITVYSGPNGSSGPIDTYTRMVDDDNASVLSTSWGVCEAEIDPNEQNAETNVFLQAAMQGQTVVAAAGDAGSSDCYDPNPPVDDTDTSLQVDDPADQPYVTGVGGTSLTSAGANAPSESVWNNSLGAGGGGVSTVFPAPSWQSGVGATHREVPDVSASADPEWGDVVYWEGTWGIVGGTSQASPLWAALVAVGNQGCAARSGLLNPALYSATTGSFNDITVGGNDLVTPGGTHYPATTGYDLASGWGTPRAPGLMTVLSGSSTGCPALTGLSAHSGPAVGGNTVVISGTGFGSSTPTVHFGSRTATVTAHTPSSITVTAPDVTFGVQIRVTVTTSGVSAGTTPQVPAGTYTFVSPQVTAVRPGKGPTTGGALVTISGSDFNHVSSVRFGSASATSYTVTSATTVEARVPTGPSAGGVVDVVVANADGVSPTSTADHYAYVLPGYWLTASDGGIFAFGQTGFFGSTGGIALNKPVVGMAATATDRGYWLVASDSGIFAFGDAAFYGSTGSLALNKPIVGMATTPDGRGYWLVASDGGIFAFGDAAFYGSTGSLALNKPIVGMATTPDGRGYWLVASDGGIFAFGDAAFYGSTGSLALNKPIVGMAASPDGRGYWLVASDGGIFAFGDASFAGSTGSLALNKPIVGMAASLTGKGYWLVASDGGIFAFGDASFAGSTGSLALNKPIVGMAAT